MRKTNVLFSPLTRQNIRTFRESRTHLIDFWNLDQDPTLDHDFLFNLYDKDTIYTQLQEEFFDDIQSIYDAFLSRIDDRLEVKLAEVTCEYQKEFPSPKDKASDEYQTWLQDRAACIEKATVEFSNTTYFTIKNRFKETDIRILCDKYMSLRKDLEINETPEIYHCIKDPIDPLKDKLKAKQELGIYQRWRARPQGQAEKKALDEFSHMEVIVDANNAYGKEIQKQLNEAREVFNSLDQSQQNKEEFMKQWWNARLPDLKKKYMQQIDSEFKAYGTQAPTSPRDPTSKYVKVEIERQPHVNRIEKEVQVSKPNTKWFSSVVKWIKEFFE